MKLILAIFWTLGHMVVDRTKFKDMVAKSAKDIAAKTTEASVQRMEETIQGVMAQSAAEIGSTLTMISTIIQTEQDNMKANLEQVWQETDETKQEDLSRRKDALNAALSSQQSTLQRIFDLVISKKSAMQHFLFQPRRPEEDSTEDTETAHPSEST